MDFKIVPVTSERQTDCGATCLKMLLQYYGIDVELAQLIRECNTDVIGCSAKEILRVGRAHGLDMKSFKSPAKDIYTCDRPMICWWLYNHFVVFSGIDETGKVIICNPDRGRYRVSKGVFQSFFSGIALSNGMPEDMTPAPEPQPETEEPTEEQGE